MASSGRMLGNLNDGTRCYLDWEITSQSTSGNYSNVSWKFGMNFPGTPSCRGLRNGTATINGTRVYYNYNSGDAIHGFTSGHNHTWLQVGSGSLRINHDSSGNATLSVSAGITGWQDKRSSISATASLDRIAQVPAAPAAPTVSNLAATTATLNWVAPNNNGAALNGHAGQVSRNSGFTDLLTTWEVGSWGTSRALTGLPKGSALYARVRARNSVGWSGWSSARTFTTGATAPSAPGAPSISGVGATSATAAWTAPSDAGGAAVTSYEVQWSTSSSFTSPSSTASTTSPTNLTGLLPGTTYYVRTRAVNSAGSGTWSTASTFTTLSGVKVGTGTGWRDAIVRVGNGSSWVVAQVRTGNGTTWR